MKNASPGFKAAIDQEVTYLCGLVELSRRDGYVYRFTDHDEDVVIGGNTYVATRGFTRSAIMNSLSAGLSTVTLEILLADLAQEGLTEEQLRTGQFDDSLVTIYTADWRTPPTVWSPSSTVASSTSRSRTRVTAGLSSTASSAMTPRSSLRPTALPAGRTSGTVAAKSILRRWR